MNFRADFHQNKGGTHDEKMEAMNREKIVSSRSFHGRISLGACSLLAVEKKTVAKFARGGMLSYLK